MKNPQRVSQRKTSSARAAQYHEEMTKLDDAGNRVVQHPVKFIKWLRGKFGMTVAERQGAKPIDSKVGAPYQRVQHRPQARNHRG